MSQTTCWGGRCLWWEHISSRPYPSRRHHLSIGSLRSLLQLMWLASLLNQALQCWIWYDGIGGSLRLMYVMLIVIPIIIVEFNTVRAMPWLAVLARAASLKGENEHARSYAQGKATSRGLDFTHQANATSRNPVQIRSSQLRASQPKFPNCRSHRAGNGPKHWGPTSDVAMQAHVSTQCALMGKAEAVIFWPLFWSTPRVRSHFGTLALDSKAENPPLHDLPFY